MFERRYRDGKEKRFEPQKKGKITFFLQQSNLKQRDISTQTLSAVRKKLELGREMDSSRMGKCGRKRKTTPRLDRKIKEMALKNRRASYKKFSMELSSEGIMVDRSAINKRLL